MALHDISAIAARDWVAAYNNVPPANLQNIKGIKFDSTKIDGMLKNPQCAFLRIYLAKDPANPNASTTVVIVGVDSNDKDIIGNVAEYGIHGIVPSPLT
jgi:hypothetical protein